MTRSADGLAVWDWATPAEMGESLCELVVGTLLGPYGGHLLPDAVGRVAPSLLPRLERLSDDRRRWKWLMTLLKRDRFTAMRIALMVRVLMLEYVNEREPQPLADLAIESGMKAVGDWKRLAELPATTAEFMSHALMVMSDERHLARAASRHAEALLPGTEATWETREWRRWLRGVAKRDPVLATKIGADAALQTALAHASAN